MKREIKFRAWNHKTNEMLPHHDNSGKLYALECQKHPDTYTITQFSGFHDRNGNEVFEGDILLWRKPMSLLGGDERVGTLEKRYEVIWEGGFYQKGDMSNHLMFGDLEYSEVIGNIYENPD